MTTTHLIISPEWTEDGSLICLAELVLTGNVEPSPMISYNDMDCVLYASYTHADQITENLYRPLLLTDSCRH